MFQLEIKDLLEAGAHFGHQTKRWNPKMKPYIYGVRNSIHIIDLSKTLPLAEAAYRFLEEKIGNGEDVLLSARNVRPRYYRRGRTGRNVLVGQRWLSGTLAISARSRPPSIA